MSELPDPACADCIAFSAEPKGENGEVMGRCTFRAELGRIPNTFPFCDLFQVRREREGLVNAPGKKKKTAGRKRTEAPSTFSAPLASLRRPTTGDTEGEITVDRNGLKQVIRELLEEEAYYGYPELAGRWENGKVVLHPGGDQQPKEIPIESFFNKVVMVRDRLRVLEAKINANTKLTNQDKVELQGYISKSYGSLTTFNVLFRNKDDQFSSKSRG